MLSLRLEDTRNLDLFLFKYSFNLFFVLDSHVHTIDQMSYDNLLKYIKYEICETDNSSHLHITILCCA